MITLKYFNQRGLSDLIEDEAFDHLNDFPITKHRGLSQINNPRLDTEDVILILAYSNDEVVGYVGVLPDLLFEKNNRVEKIGWLSTFWVSPNARGKSIGSQLMKAALDVWYGKIISADYVPQTKVIYDRSNAFYQKPLERKGIRLYVRSDLQTILPPKKKFFQRTKFFLKIFDSVFNSIFNLRFIRTNQRVEGINIEYMDQVDDELKLFFENKIENQPFQRNAEILNWIIRYPWVLSSSQKTISDQRYYFSSTAKSFQFRILKIRDAQQKIIGLMIFSERNGILKLPYCYFDSTFMKKAELINYLLVKWKIKMFTTFQPDLVEALKKGSTSALAKKEVIRYYLLSKYFDRTLFENNFQDGDGDCCFT